MATHTNSIEEKLPFQEKFGYGLGDLASNLVFTAMSIFLTFYYTDIIGIPAAVVGTIMLVSRLFDGVTDVGMGVLVDKTQTRFGKARPWLLWMCLPFGVATLLTFSVPDNTLTLQVVFILVTYNLLNLVYTAINIPYGVLNALSSKDPHQRTLLNIFRTFMANVGVIAVSQIVMPLVQFFGGGKDGWQMAFAIMGFLASILFLITFLTTKERIASDSKAHQAPLKQGLKALFSNRYWLLVLVFFVCFFTVVALCFNTPVYYAQYILKDPSLIGMLILGSVAPQLAALFFMPALVKRYGKTTCVKAGALIMIGSYLYLLTNPYDSTTALIATAVKGIGLAPIFGSVFAMLADTIDYGEWKTGIRTEGLTYSAGSFGSKVGIGLGSAIVGWVLSWGNYAGGQPEQTPEALQAIISIFVTIPCSLCAVLFLLMMLYPLDKQLPAITLALKSRHNSATDSH